MYNGRFVDSIQSSIARTSASPGPDPLHRFPVPLLLSERQLSVAVNLSPRRGCCMNRCCEKALFQRGETARGAKPHGGCAQGSPQSTGRGGASAAGFASWQRREMAHHQFQAGRPCAVQTGIACAFPSNNSRKSSKHATRQDSLTFSSEVRPSTSSLLQSSLPSQLVCHTFGICK